jgi:hypothetical protein
MKNANSIIQDLPTMTKEQMLCLIRSHKQLKTSISGYSSMKLPDLRSMLEKALKGQKPNPRKTTQTKWRTALQEYNKGKSGFLIPKKGSNEYQAVLDIMNGKKHETVQNTVPQKKRGRPRKEIKKEKQEEPASMPPSTESMSGTKKRGRPRKEIKNKVN